MTSPKSILLIPAVVVLGFGYVFAVASGDTRSVQVRFFIDCALCPEMVRIPAGQFRQGDLQGTGDEDEQPVRAVAFARPFALGRTEITNEHWDACVADNGCDVLPEEELDPAQRSRHPVQNASWHDAQSYVAWLSAQSGQSYRLPTESEFEYAARAGADMRYFWGDLPSRQHSNFGTDDCCGGAAFGDDRWVGTAPAGSMQSNDFGLFDMAGNVQEWVEDCWFDSYEGAPRDGSAREEGGDCDQRGLRGGSWSSTPKMIRPANRDKGYADVRLPYYGFRVARDLD